MCKRKCLSAAFLALLLFLTGGVLAEELTGDEIMDRVDDNQFIASGRLETEMIVIERGRERIMEMINYVESDGEVTNALVEFINPRDRGTKYLLRDGELRMYFPEAEELIRISGHLLEDDMMGSDFSYQDALESEQLTELYRFEKEKREEIDGRDVYVIRGEAREGEDPAYRERRFWVDVERFVVLREEMYARDGQLLRVMRTEEVKEVQEGRWMPVEMVMENELRVDSKTIYRINKIELDYDIPENKLSLEALE